MFIALSILIQNYSQCSGMPNMTDLNCKLRYIKDKLWRIYLRNGHSEQRMTPVEILSSEVSHTSSEPDVIYNQGQKL